MFANTPDDLASRETLLSMSGLAFMEATRDGTLPQPAIARLLNYRLGEVEPGRVFFRERPASITATCWARSMAAGTARCSTVRWPAR